MKYALTVLAAVLGFAVEDGVGGLLLGGLIGFLLDQGLARQRALEAQIEALSRKLQTLERLHPPESYSPDAERQPPTPSTAPSDVPREGQQEPRREGFPPGQTERQPPRPQPMRGPTPPPREAGPARSPAGPRLPNTESFLHTFAEIVLGRLKQFLAGGNAFVRIGLLLLFIGLAFLIKLAADNDYLPIELRLLATALSGLALCILGWRLRTRRPEYGLALQGGGIAILYLTVFVAYRVYALLPGAAAFVLLALSAAAGTYLALLQRSQSLAVLSILGGFFAPVLASSGEGSHIVLFTYYGILNAGIFGIACFRAWRALSLVGFTCTFGVAALWGGLHYNPDVFGTTEPFLALFFLYYFGISMLHVRHRSTKAHDALEGTLVFGLPVATFALQASLVEPFAYGLAASSFVLAIVYATTGLWLLQRNPEAYRLLAESYLGIAVAFGTLTFPFALDPVWTGAAWALEGTALVWLGIRQRRRLSRAAGMLLQAAAGLSFLAGSPMSGIEVPVLNHFFAGCLTLTTAACLTARWVHIHSAHIGKNERHSEPVFLIVALGWWLAGGFSEIVRETADAQPLMVCFLALTAVTCVLAGTHLAWPNLRRGAVVLLPALYGLAFRAAALGQPWVESWASLMSWAFAVAVHYAALRRMEADLPGALRGLLHAAGVWFVALLSTQTMARLIRMAVEPEAVWPDLAYALLPVLLVFGITLASRSSRWPFHIHRSTYLLPGLAPLVVWVWAWALAMSTRAADPTPLVYLPLLNPLDITLALAAGAGIVWFRAVRQDVRAPYDTFGPWALTLTAFVWLNATIARTVHHWTGVPFDGDALFDAVLFQTALSICWTVLAVVVMVVAARRSARLPWSAAAVLLAIVVLKLFTVDLASVSTIARIVSFVGVGLLLLVVGYIAPVPPRRAEPAEQPSPA